MIKRRRHLMRAASAWASSSASKNSRERRSISRAARNEVVPASKPAMDDFLQLIVGAAFQDRRGSAKASCSAILVPSIEREDNTRRLTPVDPRSGPGDGA